MKTLKSLFKNAKVRLAAKSLILGAGVAYYQLKGHPIDKAALDAALVAGGWAALESFTPLNAAVGWFKQAR